MKTLFTLCTLLLFAFAGFSQTRIQMQKENGVYTVPCKINGLKMKFIFDTGASNVCISLTEAIFMLRNDYLNEEDILNSSYAQIANGSIIENTKIIIRELEIGGLLLRNIEAVVVHELKAPLLLGQSAIQKLGTIQIQGNELVIMQEIKYEIDERYIESPHSLTYMIDDTDVDDLKLKEYNKFLFNGLELLTKGLYDLALGSLKKQIINTDNKQTLYITYNNIGVIYHEELDNNTLAIEFYKKAIQTDFEDISTALSNMGKIYKYKLKMNDIALKYFKEAVVHNPNDVESIINIAYIYLAMNNFREAERYFNIGSRMIPDNNLAKMNIYLDAGEEYAKKRKYNEAINYFKKAGNWLGDALHYDIYISCNRIVYSLCYDKNYNEAIIFIKKVIDEIIKDDDWKFWGLLCDVYLKNKQFKEAIYSAKIGLALGLFREDANYDIEEAIEEAMHIIRDGRDGEHINWCLSYLSLGYILTNRWNEAEEIYVQYRGKKYGWADSNWEEIFLYHIENLENAGIIHPDFNKVKTLLKE
jgi:clan AA aspartic protease (TIGR02281 family)